MNFVETLSAPTLSAWFWFVLLVHYEISLKINTIKPAHKRTTYVESAYSWYAIEGSQLADGNDWNPSNRNADIEYRLPGEINRTFPFDSFRFISCWTFYSFFLPFFCLRSVVCSLIQPMKCLLRSFEVRCIHCRCVHIKYSIFVWITLLFMQ